jgi:hypothetical protein
MRPRILPIGLMIGLVLLAILSSSCSRGTAITDQTGDLLMSFTGFTPENGRTMFLKVVDETNETSHISGTMAPRVISTDSFMVEVPNAITNGHSYHIDFGVDVDGDGVLTFGVDHTWRISDSVWSADMLRDFAYDTNWTDIGTF